MTLQQMKDKASLSELALIERVEAAIRPALTREITERAIEALDDFIVPHINLIVMWAQETHRRDSGFEQVVKKIREKMLAGSAVQ